MDVCLKLKTNANDVMRYTDVVTCGTTLKSLTIVIYQHSQSLRSFVNVNNFFKKSAVYPVMSRYFSLLCNVLRLSSDIKNSIIDIQLCLKDQLRQKIKDLR